METAVTEREEKRGWLWKIGGILAGFEAGYEEMRAISGHSAAGCGLRQQLGDAHDWTAVRVHLSALGTFTSGKQFTLDAITGPTNGPSEQPILPAGQMHDDSDAAVSCEN